jgi:hypothetical protein
MSPWESVLLAFGGNAILLAILALLAKSLLSQFLAKDLRHFEDRLAERSRVATEEARHQLALLAHEHNVRFTKLHERQSEVLEGIYTRILQFEDASGLIDLVDNTTKPDLLDKSLNFAQEAGNELYSYSRRNQIFLSESTSLQVQAFIDRVNSLLLSCTLNVTDRVLQTPGEGLRYPEHTKAWSDMQRFLREEAPTLRKALEDEFRKHLGAARSDA